MFLTSNLLPSNRATSLLSVTESTALYLPTAAIFSDRDRHRPSTVSLAAHARRDLIGLVPTPSHAARAGVRDSVLARCRVKAALEITGSHSYVMELQ